MEAEEEQAEELEEEGALPSGSWTWACREKQGAGQPQLTEGNGPTPGRGSPSRLPDSLRRERIPGPTGR